jgi:hypothetical protein
MSNSNRYLDGGRAASRRDVSWAVSDFLLRAEPVGSVRGASGA